MKILITLLVMSLELTSLFSQTSVKQKIEGTGVGLELGLSIEGTGFHGIQVVGTGGSGGVFLTSDNSVQSAIKAGQQNNSGLYSDVELLGSQVIGSAGNIYLNIDNELTNMSEDPNFFGVIHGDKSDPVFFVDQDGSVVANGSLSAKKITATNVNDSQPDLEISGANGFIKATAFNSNLRLESNGNITVQVGKSNGTSTTSKFAILDQTLQEAFSVDETGTTRIYTTLVTSDRNQKENITSVSPENILINLLDMPIYKWNYKKKDRQHIGPMAQDFLTAFHLGTDGTTISSLDADGISLAAIKGLYQWMQKELDKKDEKIEKLAERLEKMELKN